MSPTTFLQPRPPVRPLRIAIALGLGALATLGVAVALSGCGATSAPGLTVVATGLANPRQLSIGSDGAVYVAEAGSGGHIRCTRDPETNQQICLGTTGVIARLEAGRAVAVLGGLPSVAGANGEQASGPAAVLATPSGLAVVVQDTRINAAGANDFGPQATALGRLVIAQAGGRAPRLGADFARYEATHNPDHGAGAAGAMRIESDPYGIVAYRAGYAVADAAGNDLLWVDPAGAIHVLAVFPTQAEPAPPGSKGPARIAAQSVPTSVAAGPDGALYVGELTGYPFALGSARVWRVVPGVPPTVFAGGFTNISAIAFDRRGRLLVLEIDRRGLNDNRGQGALIRLEPGGRRSVLATDGLVYPTGLAVSRDGAIYISNHGSQPATGAGPHGEILRLSAAP